MRSRLLSLASCLPFALACLGACDSGGAASKGAAKSAQPSEPPAAKPADQATPADQPPAPSDEPSQTWTQRWATPTGQASAHVAAVRDGRVYAIAGAYLEHGTPATHLVCLAEDSGEQLWTHVADEPLSLIGLSDELIVLGHGEGATHVSTATGKPTKPSKAASDATQEVSPPPAEGCEPSEDGLRCAGWSVKESGRVGQITGPSGRVCYAVEGSREIRCRDAKTGDLIFAVAVPAVPEVKHPGGLNFNFDVTGDRLIIGNYDGTVLAYGPS